MLDVAAAAAAVAAAAASLHPTSSSSIPATGADDDGCIGRCGPIAHSQLPARR